MAERPDRPARSPRPGLRLDARRRTTSSRSRDRAMNWVMSAGVAPLRLPRPVTFRVVGRTDSTNLRMHSHRGELMLQRRGALRRRRRLASGIESAPSVEKRRASAAPSPSASSPSPRSRLVRSLAAERRVPPLCGRTPSLRFRSTAGACVVAHARRRPDRLTSAACPRGDARPLPPSFHVLRTRQAIERSRVPSGSGASRAPTTAKVCSRPARRGAGARRTRPHRCWPGG